MLSVSLLIQVCAAVGPAKTMKIHWFFNVFSIFCHLVSKMRQDVAKMRQERPKMSQERRKLSQDRLQDGPREGQDRDKLGQDAANVAQDGTKSLDFGGFWLILKP